MLHRDISASRRPKQGGMRVLAMPPKKPIFFFLFLFSALSLIRLFNVAFNNSTVFVHPSSPTTSNPCTTSSLTIMKDNPKTSTNLRRDDYHLTEDILSPKENQLLSDLISTRVPCNLLFFGFKPQFLTLAKLNTKGTTIFLEDDPQKLKSEGFRGMEAYLVDSHERADKAYELLEHARKHPACRPRSGPLHASRCKLALKGLPAAAGRRKWDVVVVDGPSGNRPEAPGRMGSIYTAAMIAQAGNEVNVLVHDTDRMIEKWYSWEFLCHENLVSSKGRLWHFRIQGNSTSETFCSKAAIQIQ